MSRAKLSEYRAKVILGDALGSNYIGLTINVDDIDTIKIKNFMDKHGDRYVIKVDQAIKRRNKLGLVDLDVMDANVHSVIKRYADLGYQWLLLEPFVPHKKEDEKFIAMEFSERGIDITYSAKGGVDIESHADSFQKICVKTENLTETINGVPDDILHTLITLFNEQHLTYLEINPFLLTAGGLHPLDAAFEVDTSAAFFVNGWTLNDIRTPAKNLSHVEKRVEEIASKSPASLSLKVLNPDGATFLLLSGGGASVVVLDELSSYGLQGEVANYGEYSGNPNEEETYLYAAQIIQLILTSNSERKILLIAGGVANFTDIHHTFKGVVRALSENIEQLQGQGVQVIVRRGGPNQAQGLAYMKKFLDDEKIANEVYGPDVSLSQAVGKVREAIK